MGYILLLFSLLCDGLCGGMQEKVRNTFSPSECHMMLWTNFFSCFIILPPLVATNQLFGANAFIQNHPEIVPKYVYMKFILGIDVVRRKVFFSSKFFTSKVFFVKSFFHQKFFRQKFFRQTFLRQRFFRQKFFLISGVFRQQGAYPKKTIF